MKTFGRSAAFAVTAGLLAVGVLSAPAAAHNAPVLASDTVTIETHTRGDGTQPPAHLGNPTEWGVVTITEGSTGDFTPLTVLEIGGGTWSYGKNLTTDGPAGGGDPGPGGGDPKKPPQTGQYCYSNYYHPTVQHGSTVKLAGATNKAVAGVGKWSYANLTAGAIHTCETYYAKY